MHSDTRQEPAQRLLSGVTCLSTGRIAMKAVRKEGWFFGRFVNFVVSKGKQTCKIRTNISVTDTEKRLSLNLSDVMKAARLLKAKEAEIEQACQNVASYQWKFQPLVRR